MPLKNKNIEREREPAFCHLSRCFMILGESGKHRIQGCMYGKIMKSAKLVFIGLHDGRNF